MNFVQSCQPIRRPWLCGFVLATVLGSPGVANGNGWRWFNPRIVEIENRSAQIDQQLRRLGRMSIGSNVECRGSQFHMFLQPHVAESYIQLDLRRSQRLDSIMLVPVKNDYAAREGAAFGFPPSLRIDGSDDPDFQTLTPIAEFEDTSFESLHGLPLVVKTPKTRARYIRVTATSLAKVAGRWTYAFDEVIVMRGNRNIAIDAEVTMPGSVWLPPAWRPENLIDAQTTLGPPIVYEPPEFDGVYCAPATPSDPNFMMLDLGRSWSIDEIRLQPIYARQGAFFAGYGFPRRLRLELGADAEMNDATIVFDSGDRPYPNPGNSPAVFTVDQMTARYIKVTCLEPSMTDRGRFGLSEFQVYSEDQNVAAGAAVHIPPTEIEPRDPKLLVDGYCSHGKLIELPVWVDRWDRYRRLLIDRHTNAEMSEQAVAGAKRRAAMAGSVSLLGVGLMAVSTVSFYRRRRQVEKRQFRMRLAQDLHDEVGSNLAAIARLGELAEIESSKPQVRNDLTMIRELALDCTESIRTTLWLLGGPRHRSANLIDSLHQVGQRMLCHMEVRWVENVQPHSLELDEEVERSLVLIVKEIFANIVKHAVASAVVITLDEDDGMFKIIIQDDGVGFLDQGPRPSTDPDQQKQTLPDGSSIGMGLEGIRKRVGELGGTFGIDSGPKTGTIVQVAVRATSPKRR